MNMFGQKKGFTLIELLIVVAIIGILAAIAIPNFLEAQTRAKVAKAKSEIRNLAVSLETYYIDNGGYPPATERTSATNDLIGIDCGTIDISDCYTVGASSRSLTTPVSHQSIIPFDPFDPVKHSPENYFDKVYEYGSNFLGYWIMTSYGPDQDSDMEETDYVDPNGTVLGEINDYLLHLEGTYPVYDPTNGTVSNGDLFRTGP